MKVSEYYGSDAKTRKERRSTKDIQDCVGACHPKIISFVITYLLEDEQELSLGMLIHLQRIHDFLCSMLLLTPFA
jgi:hypothetical protein